MEKKYSKTLGDDEDQNTEENGLTALGDNRGERGR